ncbi:hypothetical protein HY477_01865 [Candidatus Uhrbacteria bacterium]|nr:hypothetical protein [Candidatus Uhrbacteria bacterium]
MPKFLYIFGYETPGLAAMNKSMTAKGIYSDCEDSEWFFIPADTKEQALEWGEKLADEYMKVLYNDPSATRQSHGSAGWIEERGPLVHWDEKIIKMHPEEYAAAVKNVDNIPVIKVGEYPDIQKLVHERYGPADLNPSANN